MAGDTYHLHPKTGSVHRDLPNSLTYSSRDTCPVLEKRPVVVIDPESADDVDGLVDAVWTGHRSDRPATWRVQDALREFANPTPPKPEEPTGLGAAVEATAYTDAIRIFVRTAGDLWVDAKGICHDWAELDVTEVLSEGVTP